MKPQTAREEEIKLAASCHIAASNEDFKEYYEGFITGAKWADETMIERGREWVKNAFVGPFGEDMANSIADEFVKKMKGE